MTDHYEKIRKALAMGPTIGPYLVDQDNGNGIVVVDGRGNIVAEANYGDVPSEYGPGVTETIIRDLRNTHRYIAACDPDTIRALLAERDALVEALAAQQPAAVDEAMVFRLAVWMANHDGCEDPHRLIYEGSPPVPWGEVWNRYEYDARAALTAAHATEPLRAQRDELAAEIEALRAEVDRVQQSAA